MRSTIPVDSHRFKLNDHVFFVRISEWSVIEFSGQITKIVKSGYKISANYPNFPKGGLLVPEKNVRRLSSGVLEETKIEVQKCSRKRAVRVHSPLEVRSSSL